MRTQDVFNKPLFLYYINLYIIKVIIQNYYYKTTEIMNFKNF